MFEGHDRIVLTEDIAVAGLKAGDVGTIVHVHRGGEAFEVFCSGWQHGGNRDSAGRDDSSRNGDRSDPRPRA